MPKLFHLWSVKLQEMQAMQEKMKNSLPEGQSKPSLQMSTKEQVCSHL
jgi:hypothetical protein